MAVKELEQSEQEAPVAHSSDLKNIRDLLIIACVWRAAVLAIGVFAKATLAPNPLLVDWQGTKKGIGIWNQWDANFYLSIADQGYARPDWPAFFPLFPLVVRTWRWITGSIFSIDGAALVVNFLILAGAIVVLYLLGKELFDEASGKRAAFYILVFPTAIFLGVAYAEALYLLTTVSAFLAAEKRKWWLAGLMGALASATRVSGILILPALGISYLQQRGWKIRKLGFQWLWLALVPLGFVAYFGWLELSGRGYNAYREALELVWPGRRPTLNLVRTAFLDIIPFVRGRDEEVWGSFIALLDFGAIIGSVIGLVFMWRLLPKGYFVYCALLLFTILSSSIPVGAARYALGMFPLFLLLGRLGRFELWDRFYLIASVAMFGFVTARFAVGYWAG